MTNCRFSYEAASKYMQVARTSKNADLRTFDGGVRAFLEAHATPRPAPVQAPIMFDHEDAEWVLKVHARAERGVGGERQVAATKLANRAAALGLASPPRAFSERAATDRTIPIGEVIQRALTEPCALCEAKAEREAA